MQFTATPLAIPEVLLIAQPRFEDSRGAFSVTYEASAFRILGLPEFVQDNQAWSARHGTLRGLHFQRDPHAQAKLVRVLRGAIYDVAVDLRPGSATRGRWVGVTLTPTSEQIFIPRGFAHGYCTLSDDTEVAYRCDGAYAPQAEGGILFSDPDLAIDWPVAADAAVLSDKDRRWPRLRDAEKAA
jgi:dTDP-4-dehydrorhamnose 3,5-epimerase